VAYLVRTVYYLGYMWNKEKAGQAPEVSPFADVGDADLIERFFDSEGDPAIGRELSIRLLKHANYVGDPTTEPLLKEGKPMFDEASQRTLTLADYVYYANKNYFWALEEILDFLYTEPGSSEYQRGLTMYERHNGTSDSQDRRG
jgi:hypothetical protein